MDVGSKNIFQSQTRQGPQVCAKKCKYLQGRVLFREGHKR